MWFIRILASFLKVEGKLKSKLMCKNKQAVLKCSLPFKINFTYFSLRLSHSNLFRISIERNSSHFFCLSLKFFLNFCVSLVKDDYIFHHNSKQVEIIIITKTMRQINKKPLIPNKTLQLHNKTL